VGTILLVDDEPYVLEGLKDTLRGQSHRVLTATSAAEGLDLLSEQPIDVVVADEMMPRMRGSELLAIVSHRHPNTVRIILTGHATLDAAVRGINEGRIFRFLQKPCRPSDFLAVVAEAFQIKALTTASTRMLEFVRDQSALLRASGGPSALSLPAAQASVLESPRSSSPLDRLRETLEPKELDSISSREIEVLEHLLAGQRVSRIAKLLYISTHTVRNHLKALFQKLNVHSQAELISKCRGIRSAGGKPVVARPGDGPGA
jgi:DNA-binding NarL/FixJ family response regulator